MSTLLLVERAPEYSPNAMEKDHAILQAVAHQFGDCKQIWCGEHQLEPDMQPDWVLSMGRNDRSLSILSGFEARGIWVVNSVRGVKNAVRQRLNDLLQQASMPLPPAQGDNGYWLKRADSAAQCAQDVCYCEDAEALETAKQTFAARGVKQTLTQAHCPGDLIKFYGVGTSFFRYYYPTDDNDTPFGREHVNGKAAHYPFDVQEMQQRVANFAQEIGLAVYGGDCVVDATGHWVLIDLNDWPSFSRCREEAATAIATYIRQNRLM